MNSHRCDSGCYDDHSADNGCWCDNCEECHFYRDHHWSMWAKTIDCDWCMEDYMYRMQITLREGECADHEGAGDECRMCAILEDYRQAQQN